MNHRRCKYELTWVTANTIVLTCETHSPTLPQLIDKFKKKKTKKSTTHRESNANKRDKKQQILC